jgi:hypothetical protein
MDEKTFDFVGLFDFNGNAEGVDGAFYEDFFAFVTTDHDGVEEDFFGDSGKAWMMMFLAWR